MYIIHMYIYIYIYTLYCIHSYLRPEMGTPSLYLPIGQSHQASKMFQARFLPQKNLLFWRPGSSKKTEVLNDNRVVWPMKILKRDAFEWLKLWWLNYRTTRILTNFQGVFSAKNSQQTPRLHTRNMSVQNNKKELRKHTKPIVLKLRGYKSYLDHVQVDVVTWSTNEALPTKKTGYDIFANLSLKNHPPIYPTKVQPDK